MLEKLVEMSNRYGSNPAYVLVGGGNTSYKEGNTLYVKGSGTSLASVREQDFVSMDRGKLKAMLTAKYPKTDSEREAAALKDMMAARLPGNEEKRPSVEAPLHNLFPYSYVLHVHPALINGMTCGQTGEKDAHRLLGDDFVWVPLSRPGYALSVLCDKKLNDYEQKTGEYAKLLLLQNHGIFVAADTVEEIDALMKRVMDALQAYIKEQPDLAPVEYDKAQVAELEEQIKKLYSQEMFVDFVVNKQILTLIDSTENFAPLSSAFTPDHIVYCKAKFLYVKHIEEMSQLFELFVRDNGYLPKVVCIRGVGVFIVGPSEKEMNNARELFNDAISVAVYANSFGGYLHMTDELVDFILNWEMESYRQKVAAE